MVQRNYWKRPSSRRWGKIAINRYLHAFNRRLKRSQENSVENQFISFIFAVSEAFGTFNVWNEIRPEVNWIRIMSFSEISLWSRYENTCHNVNSHQQTIFEGYVPAKPVSAMENFHAAKHADLLKSDRCTTSEIQTSNHLASNIKTKRFKRFYSNASEGMKRSAATAMNRRIAIPGVRKKTHATNWVPEETWSGIMMIWKSGGRWVSRQFLSNAWIVYYLFNPSFPARLPNWLNIYFQHPEKRGMLKRKR